MRRISFECFPRSGITRVYGTSIFSFLRNLYIRCHSGCTVYSATCGEYGFFFLHISAALVFFLFPHFINSLRIFNNAICSYSLSSFSSQTHSPFTTIFFFFFFKTWPLQIALAVIELNMKNRLTSNSEIHWSLCLLSTGTRDMYRHA